MEYKQLSCIAAASCTSKATVSKALNHCYGVGAQVRSRVFAEADRAGAKQKAATTAVYAIFPETPGYFKKCAMPHPEDLPVKYNIYSRLGEEAMLLRYLEEAEAMEAKVILLAARLTPRITHRLESMPQKCLVIFLAEYCGLTNTFFVGSDPARDAKLLASACTGENGRWLVLKDGTPADQVRCRAFEEEMVGKAELDVLELEADQEIARMPSLLARILSRHIGEQHCGVVCLNGSTGAVCAAVRKLRLNRRFPCVGFGDDGLKGQFAGSGILKGAVYPDFSGQLDTAMELARRYCHTGMGPDRKFLFVESRMEEYK